MSASIVTALVSLLGVLAVGVLVPIFLLGRTERVRRDDLARQDQMHREDRDAEWARQDKVAADAKAAAQAIAERADQAAALLLATQQDSAAAQVQVAEQAREAAALLLARQQEGATAQREVAEQAREAARLLAENNHLVAETAKETGKKLDTIHELVNSNLTKALQDQYDAVSHELAVMKELIALRREMGQEPSQDALSDIVKTQAKLYELDAALADRAKAQQRVNDQIGLDIVTTTSYRRQDQNAPASSPQTAAEVSAKSPGGKPQGDEPQAAASYQDEPPPGHDGGGTPDHH